MTKTPDMQMDHPGSKHRDATGDKVGTDHDQKNLTCRWTSLDTGHKDATDIEIIKEGSYQKQKYKKK